MVGFLCLACGGESSFSPNVAGNLRVRGSSSSSDADDEDALAATVALAAHSCDDCRRGIPLFDARFARVVSPAKKVHTRFECVANRGTHQKREGFLNLLV